MSIYNFDKLTTTKAIGSDVTIGPEPRQTSIQRNEHSTYNFNSEILTSSIGDGAFIYSSGTQLSKENIVGSSHSLCTTVCVEEEEGNPQASGAAGNNIYFWEENSSVLVYFMDGDESLIQLVLKTAAKWSKYSTIIFERTDDQSISHIRISFKENNCWSIIGIQCKLFRHKGKATMQLGGILVNEKTKKSLILHEFGHALGLIHEHQSPNATIPWDMAKVFSHYEKKGWSRDKIINNVLQPKACSNYSEFDQKSVMIYPILLELLDDTNPNFKKFIPEQRYLQSHLSKADKEFFPTYYKQNRN